MSATPTSDPLTTHLAPWPELPWPADWAERFGRDAPVALELGFGNGEFLERQLRERPELNWVGAEISWASARRLFNRLGHLPGAHAQVLVGDGVFLLEHLFPRGSLAEIHLNHPDPWPKKRHHGRRVVQPAFVDLAARRLVPGGTLTVVTDHADYADWIAGVLEGQKALAPAHGATRVHELPGRVRTKYERKGREAGSRIHYFIWRKAGDGGPEPPHVETLNTMPNVMLEGAIGNRELLPGLEPRLWTEKRRGVRILVQILAVYGREDRAAPAEWLVEGLVQEDAFIQHVGISVVPRQDGRILIKPASFGFPRPTYGLKLAVRRLAELILEAHPDLRLHASTVGEVTPEPEAP